MSVYFFFIKGKVRVITRQEKKIRHSVILQTTPSGHPHSQPRPTPPLLHPHPRYSCRHLIFITLLFLTLRLLAGAGQLPGLPPHDGQAHEQDQGPGYSGPAPCCRRRCSRQAPGPADIILGSLRFLAPILVSNCGGCRSTRAVHSRWSGVLNVPIEQPWA